MSDEMEDDFTHYFNATGRLSRRCADLERQLADKRTVPLETLRRVAALLERVQLGTEHTCPECYEGADYTEDSTPLPCHREGCELAALRGVLEGLLR